MKYNLAKIKKVYSFEMKKMNKDYLSQKCREWQELGNELTFLGTVLDNQEMYDKGVILQDNAYKGRRYL